MYNLEKFCCQKLVSVAKEQPRLMQYYQDPNDIGFASRRINFCPFCGKHFTNKSRSKLNSKTFCCDGMACDTKACDPCDEFDIYYQSFVRRYFFSKCRKWKEFDLRFGIKELYQEWELCYCIHCGTKLPKSLEDQWSIILSDKFDVVANLQSDAGIAETLNKIPEEFRTDAWWKNRGPENDIFIVPKKIGVNSFSLLQRIFCPQKNVTKQFLSEKLQQMLSIVEAIGKPFMTLAAYAKISKFGKDLYENSIRTSNSRPFGQRGIAAIYLAQGSLEKYGIHPGDYFYLDLSTDGQFVEVFFKDKNREKVNRKKSFVTRVILNFDGTLAYEKTQEAMGFKLEDGKWVFKEDRVVSIDFWIQL